MRVITSRGRKEGGWDQSGGHKNFWMVGNVSIARWHMGVYTIQYTTNSAFLQTTVKHYVSQRNANQCNHCYGRERVLGSNSKALIWILWFTTYQLRTWKWKWKWGEGQSCPTLFDPMDCIVYEFSRPNTQNGWESFLSPEEPPTGFVSKSSCIFVVILCCLSQK